MKRPSWSWPGAAGRRRASLSIHLFIHPFIHTSTHASIHPPNHSRTDPMESLMASPSRHMTMDTDGLLRAVFNHSSTSLGCVVRNTNLSNCFCMTSDRQNWGATAVAGTVFSWRDAPNTRRRRQTARSRNGQHFGWHTNFPENQHEKDSPDRKVPPEASVPLCAPQRLSQPPHEHTNTHTPLGFFSRTKNLLEADTPIRVVTAPGTDRTYKQQQRQQQQHQADSHTHTHR